MTSLKVRSKKRGSTFGGKKEWFPAFSATEEGENETEEGESRDFHLLQANYSNKTSYNNYLAEEGENQNFRLLPQQNRLLPQVDREEIEI